LIDAGIAALVFAGSVGLLAGGGAAAADEDPQPVVNLLDETVATVWQYAEPDEIDDEGDEQRLSGRRGRRRGSSSQGSGPSLKWSNGGLMVPLHEKEGLGLMGAAGPAWSAA
jgi:hypothetical protein